MSGALGTPSDSASPEPATPPGGRTALRIVSNAGAMVIGQAIQMPVSFVTSIFIVRALGADGYGTFAFVYSFLGLFDWIATFGLENTLVREAARSSGQTEPAGEAAPPAGRVIGSGTAASLGTSAFAAVAAALGYRGPVLVLLAMAAVEAIALAPPKLIGVVFQVRLEMWRQTAVTVSRHMLWLSAVAYLAAIRAPISAFVATRTVIAVLEALTIAWWGHSRMAQKFEVSRSLAVELLRHSWPLAFVSLAIAVNMRVDRVMIERFRGPGELGLYAVADNFSGLITIVPIALGRSIYPELCRRLDDTERFTSFFRASFRASVVLLSVLVVGLYSGGPKILRVIYGEDFAGSGTLMRILLLAQLGANYGAILGVGLLARKLQRAMLGATVLAAALNFAANLVAVPRWGAAGAAWVTVGSYWTSSLLVYESMQRTRSLNRIGLRALGLAAPGLAAGFALGRLPTNPLLAVALSIAGSLIGFAATGLVGKSELSLTFSMLPVRRRVPTGVGENDGA